MVVSLVNQKRTTLVAPSPGTAGAKATPAQIIALKTHVVACAVHINWVRDRMAMSQKVLATLPAADVEAAVVKGYPPPV